MKKLIFGYGATGKSVETYFQKNNIEYCIYDDDKSIKIDQNLLFDKNKLSEIDEVIISPGIKPTHELLSLINKFRISVITDIDLFNKVYNGKIIGVTGTNGKTTFVNLLNDFFNSQGIKSTAVGNIGVSPLEIIDKEYEYVVMELSSFQLYYLKQINLFIAIILNIYEDHLDWHEDWNDYVESKQKIIGYLSPKYDSETSDPYCFGDRFFGTKEPLEIESEDDPTIISEIKDTIPYFENTIDIFLEVIYSLKLNVQAAKEFIKNSEPPEHRFEKVDEFNNVLYINDSKSTNFNSVSMATRKIDNGILILHGLTKNLNSSHLKISKSIKTILVPKDMEVNLKNINAEIIKLDSINNLEHELKKIVKPGDTVLFSCGGSSFNNFKDYKERGIFFKKIVSNLKEDNA